MTRTLIPRACGAKIVETTDFEKFWSCDIVNDYVKSGFTVAAQCPNILAVDVSTGIARVKGLYVENTTAAENITCLAACMTNFLYIRVDRTACKPSGWTFTTNTTGCVPTDSMLMSTATTNCATVTAVCNDIRQTNAVPYPTADAIFGCGEDGCGVNPTVLDSASYKNLCITCNTTWARNNNIVVRVECDLTIAACRTLTWNGNICVTVTKYDKMGRGGCGGTSPLSSGGDGASADANLIIFAKNVIGTGSITAGQGVTGSAGTGGAGGPVASVAGCPGVGRCFNGETWQADGVVFFGPTTTSRIRGLGVRGLTSFSGTGGRGAASGNHPVSPDASGGGGGGGGTGGSIVLVTKNPLPAITITATGGTGGAGGPTPAGPFSSGAGGAHGGSLPWVAGGSGGAASPAPSGGGGGGGGGGAAGVFVISPCDTCVTYCLTGGAGGAGGSTPGCMPGNVGNVGGTGVLTMTFDEFRARIVTG